METTFVAALLTQPLALSVLAFAVVCSVIAGGLIVKARGGPSWQSLVVGLVGVLIVALGAAAGVSYVSPEDARTFGVDPEHYREALLQQFTVVAIVFSYACLLGTALIGIPVLVILVRFGLATVPALVLSSIPVSLIVAAALAQLSGNASDFATGAPYALAFHVIAALAFGIGAHLPWQMRSA